MPAPDTIILHTKRADAGTRGRTYVHTYKLFGYGMSEYDALASMPVAVGDEHPQDAEALCSTITAEPDGREMGAWVVTVTYSTPSGSATQSLDPFDRPADVEWDAQEMQVQFERDIEGRVVRNSAGDPFDPPVMVDAAYHVFRHSANYPSFDLGLAKQYRYAVNSDPFLTFAPGHALMRPWRAQLVYEGRTPYVRVAREILLRDDIAWNDVGILDQGFKVRQSDGSLAHYRDSTGTETATPVLLDGNGHKLADGAPPVFLTQFKRHVARPFAPLGLV